MKGRKLGTLIVAVLSAAAVQAAAQTTYPARPVRAIIAFPPGSGTDVIGRIITQKVGEYWGQQIVADNRGGAGGSIGSAIAARAAADGHTLLINSGAYTAAPYMYRKLPYSPQKDFIDIAALVAMPNVLVVHPSSRFKSVGGFIAEAKSDPGKINFAFAGLGSGTHLNNEKFKLAAGIQFTNVAYKGSGEILTDLMAGRVDSYFTPLSAGINFIKSGKVRALAVTSRQRASQLPNVPTIAESGVPDFEFLLWFGLWGPTGIPQPVLGKIRTDFARALNEPSVRERLAAVGTSPMNMTPAEFAKFVKSEIEISSRLLKAAGVKPQ